MNSLRNFNDLSISEQLEVLDGIKSILVGALLKELHAGTIQRDRIPATVKQQLATHAPSAVNRPAAPSAANELNAAAVVASVEEFLQ